MFEAVGKKYWDIYFQKLNSLLKINGTLVYKLLLLMKTRLENI